MFPLTISRRPAPGIVVGMTLAQQDAMTIHARPATAVSAVLALALTACGSDADEPTSTSTSGNASGESGTSSVGAGASSIGGNGTGGAGAGGAGATGGAGASSAGTGGLPADLFWTEDWEGTGEEAAARWAETSCGNPTAWPDNDPLGTNSSPARSADVVHTGDHSLQYHFTGLQPEHGGCYSSRHFPASDEIWMRWFERWGAGMQTAGGKPSQGGIGGAGTKRHYMYDENGNHGHVFVYMWGSRALDFAVQAVFDAVPQWDTTTLYPNATPFEMPDDQWICYEAHLKYNTPGVADGVYEGFATNMTTGEPTVQFANYQGQQWRGSSPDDPTPPTANWGTWKVYTQDGMGDIFDDDYAVGPSRIGCGTN